MKVEEKRVEIWADEGKSRKEESMGEQKREEERKDMRKWENTNGRWD